MEQHPKKPPSDDKTHQEVKPTRKELIEMLEETLKGIDRMPDHALYLPVSHYDFYSFGLLVLSILKSGD